MKRASVIQFVVLALVGTSAQAAKDKPVVAMVGTGTLAGTPGEAAAKARMVIRAVPTKVLDEVTDGLGELDGRIVVDVSGGSRRVAADGDLERIPGESNSGRIQSRHPKARECGSTCRS